MSEAAAATADYDHDEPSEFAPDDTTPLAVVLHDPGVWPAGVESPVVLELGETVGEPVGEPIAADFVAPADVEETNGTIGVEDVNGQAYVVVDFGSGAVLMFDAGQALDFGLALNEAISAADKANGVDPMARWQAIWEARGLGSAGA